MTPVLDPGRSAFSAEPEAQLHGGPVSGEETGRARGVSLGRRDLWASLLLGLCCLLVYNANLRAISAGDAYPARYLPFAIWQHHTLRLDPIAPLVAQGRGDTAFWMVSAADGHTVSLYPVVVPVLLAPLYLPAVAYLHLRGWPDGRLDYLARILEKLCASLLAALSVSLLYLALRRRATEPIALLLASAYAFGTTTWGVSSQALWQHGMAELLVSGALLLLTGPCTAPRALAVGSLCGLMAGNRPPDAILAAVLGAYGLFWAGRRALLLAAAAALPIGLVLLYNLRVVGHLAGGYGLMGKPSFFQHDLLSGLGGLLLSPTRGLFVFSPFLLFLVLAWRHRPSDRGDRGLGLAIAVGVVLQLVLYARTDWRGGNAWGPRYLTDILPLLLWMLVPVVAALRSRGRTCFLLAVGAAVAIEAIGAFWYTGVSDLALFPVAGSPDTMRPAWDWRNAPFVASFRQGLAAAELTIEMRGRLDALETAGHAAAAGREVVTAGEDTVAVGWALAGHATPLQVSVVLDGRQEFGTRTFFDRPDVRATLREASPAGWRLPLATAGLAPGEHHLTLFAWASQKGEKYYLETRRLTVQAAARPPAEKVEPAAAAGNLGDAFETAVERLRAHQQEPGYWLTSHTRVARFEEPRPEMNTYLTALLVDLLDPLAAAGGLGDSLRRARRHLTGQIEAGGLVRYHGRPDAPGIVGILGCAITPDTDDTALAWRIAPASDRRRLSAALATLRQYRTQEGLYRSWLAPREAYQCLDPGGDPNPADLTIQMHLLLLLAEVRPADGRALCAALRPVVDQDRVWVYYRMAPLVPMLRRTDLRRAGCELELPESRMRTKVPGQEIWVSLVRRLGQAPAPAGSPIDASDAAKVRAMLRQLAKDDFALLRKNPPLLYHNDLTASVPRYYWSEDVGYALWLRLAHEHAHLQHPHPNG
jgi:hypothetical protein